MKNIAIYLLILSFFHSTVFAQEVARVNGKIITNDQVNARYAELTKQNPYPVSRKTVIEELVKREVAVQEAKRLHLDQDPAVVERINTVLFFSLMEKRLSSEFDKIILSDAQAKAWYAKNPEIRTSQIYIALPLSAKPEEEKKAIEKLNSIYRDIKAGKITFGEAAQQFSEDASANMGGDLDYRTKANLDPAFYEAAVKLDKPGEISTPIRLSSGVALIRLTGKHTWIEVDRSMVKRIIIDEKRQAAVDQYLNGLQQKSSISIR